MNFLMIGLLILCFISLYLFAIMPRMLHRPDKSSFEGWLYAHRGLFDNSSQAPENSLPAFRKAVENGFGIELDVQLTKDKVPVVFHDFHLQRACAKEGKVEEYLYEELREFTLFSSKEHIPTLAEALAVIDGKVPIIVELKIEWSDYSLCPIVDKQLCQYGGVYAIESFNPIGLLWYRINHKEIVRGQLADHFRKEGTAKGPFYFLLHYLTLNFITKPDFIAYNHKYAKNLSRQICRYLYGAAAAGWTIKSQEELEKARESFDWFIFDGFIPIGKNKGKDITKYRKSREEDTYAGEYKCAETEQTTA